LHQYDESDEKNAIKVLPVHESGLIGLKLCAAA